MDDKTTNLQTPGTGAPAAATDDGKLVDRCNALLDAWGKIAAIIDVNRDANELDITVAEARHRKIVAGNETYIGRRVIADNIGREMPSYIEYLSGSRRHIAAVPIGATVGLAITTAIESEFTDGFRTGGWFDQHLQVLSSFALHGRGVFMVISAPNSELGTKAVYVPPEDFIFPLGTRDLQKAPMLLVRYSISIDQFREWEKAFAWKPDVTNALKDQEPAGQIVTKMFEVYLAVYKEAEIIQTCWFSKEQSKLLSSAKPYTSGAFVSEGQPVPATVYPFFPVFYSITENPKLIERKGRAHRDMHDQEAATMGWTGFINGLIRSGELYAAFDDTATTENPEVIQTDFVVEPGKVIKRRIKFFTPPAPDATMLSGLQALKTENASSAGQVDFAAINKKDARKTAKELSMAQDQSAAAKSVPLSMFAVGYKPMLTYMWKILVANIKAGVNTTFLAENPEAKQAMLTTRWEIHPSGDVDYVERQEQLQLYLQLYPLVQGTAVGQEFLRKLLELAFPKDYKKLEPLLQDNSKQMLGVMIQLLQNIPTDNLPPETQQQLQQILATAQESLNAPATAPTQTPAGPGGPVPPQGMAGATANPGSAGPDSGQ